MTKSYQTLVETLGEEKVKINEPLAGWTTFRIGGPADLFYEAKSSQEIAEAVIACRQLEIPYFIIGGGSNLLVSDLGIRGLVIKVSNNEIKISESNLVAGAGVPLAEIVKKAATSGLGGLEFAAGIPGSFGGAIYGNAGAWQQAIGDKVVRVLVLNSDNKLRWLAGRECEFGYRQSRFKADKAIILEAELKLTFSNKEEVEKLTEEYLNKRQSQPKEPSAGCIFINPKPDSAGLLIDQCGLKGQFAGGAEISTLHGNFIVNKNKARCQDVLELIALAKNKVNEKFKINLTEELTIVGDFND